MPISLISQINEKGQTCPYKVKPRVFFQFKFIHQKTAKQKYQSIHFMLTSLGFKAMATSGICFQLCPGFVLFRFGLHEVALSKKLGKPTKWSNANKYTKAGKWLSRQSLRTRVQCPQPQENQACCCTSVTPAEEEGARVSPRLASPAAWPSWWAPIPVRDSAQKTKGTASEEQTQSWPLASTSNTHAHTQADTHTKKEHIRSGNIRTNFTWISIFWPMFFLSNEKNLLASFIKMSPEGQQNG